MALIFMEIGGSPTFSALLTATKANVMNNKTAVTSDSNDVYAQGTLPITHVLPSSGGTIAVNYLDTFSVAQSLTVYRAVLLNFTVTARPGKPFSGIHVIGKQGSYPASREDGLDLGYYSTTGSAATFTAEQLTQSGEWYFRVWPFYRYNQRGDTTYDSIQYSTTYHEAHCYMTHYTSPVYITSSLTWTVPLGVTSAQVCCVGGGGGGCSRLTGIYSYYYGGAGGGGGYVNINTIQLTPGEEIPITIGAGGLPGYVDENNNPVVFYGSSTSFGNYLSANGGQGGRSYGNVFLAKGGDGGCGGSIGGYTQVLEEYRFGDKWYRASTDGSKEDANNRNGYTSFTQGSRHYHEDDWYYYDIINSGTSGQGQATTTIFDGIGYAGGGRGGAHYNGDQARLTHNGTTYQGGGGTANTGGGGNGQDGYASISTGHPGGSGICIIKW